MRTKSQEEVAVFIHSQITKLVHRHGERMSLGIVLFNFLDKEKEMIKNRPWLIYLFMLFIPFSLQKEKT